MVSLGKDRLTGPSPTLRDDGNHNKPVRVGGASSIYENAWLVIASHLWRSEGGKEEPPRHESIDLIVDYNVRKSLW